MSIDKNQVSKRDIVLGLSWTTLSTVVNGLSQILRLSILTRFLSKEEFGIIAILTLVLGFTQVFSDVGLSAAIMSEKILDRKRFLSLYWLQFIIFNTLVVVVSCLSPLIANYYKVESLMWLLPIMLLELSFVSVGKLYDTVLQKELHFKSICIRNIIANIISLLIAVILASIGAGVYSLIISTLSQAAIVNFWNLLVGQKEYKIKFAKIHFKEISSLLKVGGFQMGTQIVDYIASKLDIIIISSFLGVAPLGLYSLAKELIIKLVTILNTIVARVMLPVLAKYNDNIVLLRKTFIGFISRLALFNIPITGGVFLFASPIVHIFYGSNYTEAIDIVRIMSIWGLFVIMCSPNGLLSLVRKHTDSLFFYTIIRVIIMGMMLSIFAKQSLIAAAITMVVVYLIMLFVSWYLQVYKEIKLSLWDYLKNYLYIGLVVIFATFILYYISKFLVEESIISYVLLLILYVSTVLAYLCLFEKKTKKLFTTGINKIIRK